MKSAVVLYTELANYTIACLNQLALDYKVHVHVFHYPVNKEAPFKFNEKNELIKFYSKNEISYKELKEMVEFINPSLIYCSGWIDKEYLTIVKDYKGKAKTVVGFDNHWKGNLKQQFSLVLAKSLVSPLFDYAFIPGKPQKLFAEKLGFKPDKTICGVYSADTEYFEKFYLKYKSDKQKNFPRRFIFVGRYVTEKGIKKLWKAFINFKKYTNNEWELWCLGTGNISPVEHDSIKHFGFVQPAEMEKFIAQCGVFVLPSIFEPWGVVVHEYAAAGFPLLLSEAVGASTKFLEENKNGLSFNPDNTVQLENHFNTISKMSDGELAQWAEHSNQLAQQISIKTFASAMHKMMIS